VKASETFVSRVEIENRIGDPETAKQLLRNPPTIATEDPQLGRLSGNVILGVADAAGSMPRDGHPSAFRIMRSDLRYTGELPSTGNPRGPNKAAPQKLATIWKIRNEIAPQLVGVFNTHPAISSGGIAGCV
jgi:hypothetical protein